MKQKKACHHSKSQHSQNAYGIRKQQIIINKTATLPLHFSLNSALGGQNAQYNSLYVITPL